MEKITLIPEEERLKKLSLKKEPLGKGFIFALFFLIIPIALWFFFDYWKVALNNRILEIKNSIVSLDRKRNKQKEAEIISLDRRISAANNLLNEHLHWSQVFEMISSLTHSQVFFKSFSGDDKGEIELKGETLSYTNLAKQIVAFKTQPQITNVEVSGAGLQPNARLDFTIKISFNRQLLFSKLR